MNPNYPEYQPVYTYLEQLSNKYAVGVDAIALRFIIDDLEPSIILSGASNAYQLRQNLKALNFELNENEISKLKSFAVSTKNYWQERGGLKWN
jgi:aryl-alcohol dehydrogenase-like predicted oxidoreductase